MSANQEIWFTTTPNTNGNGTEALPFDGSTSAKIDAILHPLGGSITPNIVLHFTEGTYLVSANPYSWGPCQNWTILGSGPGTVLKADPNLINYTGANKYADNRCILSAGGYGGVTIRDITLDGSATDMGSQLTAPASMIAVPVGPAITPTTSVNLNITVKNSAIFSKSIGKWIVLQDSAPTNGVNLIYGTFVLNSIAGNVLNLTAVVVPYGPANMAAGTVIPATTYALILVHSNGFSGGGAGGAPTALENVTVQNVSNYIYEGPCGIYFDTEYFGTGNSASGGHMSNCTVKNIWGFASWINSIANCKDVTVTDCTILGNGYSQGLSLMEFVDAVSITNCYITGVAVGIFGDTGTFTRMTISGNTIEAIYPIQLFATCDRLTITNNKLTISNASGGQAFWMCGLPITNSIISDNTITTGAGVTNAWGINAQSGSNNQINNNEFGAGQVLSVAAGFGTRSGNTQGGLPVTF